MPATSRTSSGGGTVCDDPSHASYLRFPDANELAMERIRRKCCMEPKMLKTRGDGTGYTVHASSAASRGRGALVATDFGYEYGDAGPTVNATVTTGSMANNTGRLDMPYSSTYTGPTVNTMTVNRHYVQPAPPHMSTDVPININSPLYTTTNHSPYTTATSPSAQPSGTDEYMHPTSSKPEIFDMWCPRGPRPRVHPEGADSKPTSKGLQKAVTTDHKVAQKPKESATKKLVMIATDPKSNVETRIEKLGDGTMRTRKQWKSAATKGEVEDGWVDVGGKDEEREDEDWTLL